MIESRKDRTLITGFLGFGEFAVNPSALLAESSGRRFAMIEVSFAAAEAFVESLDPLGFETLLLMGVAGTASRMRVEHVARNIIGPTPDVRGIVRAGAINPALTQMQSTTLWRDAHWRNETPDWAPSDDAGNYLCNFIYYRALQRFGQTKRVGFLHIPPLEAMPLDRQHIALQSILDKLRI